MTNAIDNATARLADIALAMTSVSIKKAPDYPVENAEPCPFAVIYAANGFFYATNATIHHNFPIIIVEFHVSRTNIKQMQQQVNAIIYEYPKRLVADPTLNGTVQTIQYSRDTPIEYRSDDFDWGNSVKTHRIVFPIPIKLLEAPQATST